jgi:hypothetical protein
MAKAKGTVMAGLVKGIQDNRERARALVPANLHHYFETRVVLASWYPLEDYLTLLRLAVKLEKNPPPDFYEQMGRGSAREQMAGIYSRLKEDTSRRAALTLLGSMYDSGEMKMVERSPGRAVLDWVGFAIPCRELCGTFTGYQAERMSLQGMADVKARHTRCRAEGAEVCRWELTWKSTRAETPRER